MFIDFRLHNRWPRKQTQDKNTFNWCWRSKIGTNWCSTSWSFAFVKLRMLKMLRLPHPWPKTNEFNSISANKINLQSHSNVTAKNQRKNGWISTTLYCYLSDHKTNDSARVSKVFLCWWVCERWSRHLFQFYASERVRQAPDQSKIKSKTWSWSGIVLNRHHLTIANEWMAVRC